MNYEAGVMNYSARLASCVALMADERQMFREVSGHCVSLGPLHTPLPWEREKSPSPGTEEELEPSEVRLRARPAPPQMVR